MSGGYLCFVIQPLLLSHMLYILHSWPSFIQTCKYNYFNIVKSIKSKNKEQNPSHIFACSL